MRLGKILFTILVLGSVTLFAEETRSKVASNPRSRK